MSHLAENKKPLLNRNIQYSTAVKGKVLIQCNSSEIVFIVV